MMCSDGLFEARDKAGREFGLKQVEHILFNCSQKSASETLEEVAGTALRFCDSSELHDDITVVILQT